MRLLHFIESAAKKAVLMLAGFGAGVIVYMCYPHALEAQTMPAVTIQKPAHVVPPVAPMPVVMQTIKLMAPAGGDVIIPLPTKVVLDAMSPAVRAALSKPLPSPKHKKEKRNGKI